MLEPRVERGQDVGGMYRRLAEEFNPYLVGWWNECMGQIEEGKWRLQGVRGEPRRVAKVKRMKGRVRERVVMVVGFNEGGGEEDEREDEEEEMDEEEEEEEDERMKALKRLRSVCGSKPQGYR